MTKLDLFTIKGRGWSTPAFLSYPYIVKYIGARAGGGRGAAAPPNLGQLSFFGQQEKIWAKPVFKDVSMVIWLFWRPEY